MAIPYITIGCPTTGGGKVISGDSSFLVEGIPAACIGDKASCPKHKTVATIVSGDPYMQINGKAVARVNDVLSCGCKLLPQQNLVVGATGPSNGSMSSSSLSSSNNSSNFVDKNKQYDLALDKISIDNNHYSPFGLPNVAGELSAGNIKIILKVKKGNFDRITVEVTGPVGSQLISDQNGSFSPGSKIDIDWDGFINDEYDSSQLTTKGVIKLNIKGYASGQEETSLSEDVDFKYSKVKWIDTKISKKNKQVDYTLRVYLSDGGEEGLQNASSIPTVIVQANGQSPITTRNVGLADLKKFAVSGMNKYWGRNSSRQVGTDIDINGDKYQVNVQVLDTQSNALPDMKLIYVTNNSPGRSRNWELSRITYYNIGYLEYSNGWFYLEQIDADASFEETISHEIGHEILKYGGGSGYSKTHKGSSTILQNVKKGTSHPVSGEIDLMKYVENTNTTNFYDRVVASEEDVKSLIWIGGLKP